MVASPATLPHISPGTPCSGGDWKQQMGHRPRSCPPLAVCGTRTIPDRCGASVKETGSHTHTLLDSVRRKLASSSAPSSHASARPHPGHHTGVKRASSHFIFFYYFTVVANKSRCKQGLFHINILTGLFGSNK